MLSQVSLPKAWPCDERALLFMLGSNPFWKGDCDGDIDEFISQNRWVIWPTLGAIVTSVTQIKKIGWSTFRNGNHPVQMLIAMMLYGAAVGCIIAWLTKLIFH